MAELVVGVLEVRMRVRASRSLKEKRKVVRGIKDRIRARYNVSVAEFDDQDLWQALSLGFAMAGSDRTHVAGKLSEIAHQLGMHPEAELLEQDLEIL